MSLRRILITGCSGAGKSSLIDALAARGHQVAREPGRRVIRAETRQGGTGLPWADADRFARLCARIAAADWEGARIGTVFFDRGVPDAAFALRRRGHGPEAEALLARYTYDDPVFLAPPWPALFEADEDRRHGLDDAIAEYEDIAAGLSGLGRKVAILPELPVGERADWLESRLRSG
ncbi:AAA family ATPase [Rhodobacterales bacterium HKCCE2091]|nr:AAA family ATPase [Rhodobacterales bacterium HKCCE2091]